MYLTTYLRPDEPIDIAEYMLLKRPCYRRKFHYSLYAISKHPLHVPRKDGNPQALRIDGRDKRVIALRNGTAIKAYIEKHAAKNKTALHIPRSLDEVR